MHICITLLSDISYLLRKRKSQKDFENWNYFCVVLVDCETVQIIMVAYIIADVWNDASWGWEYKTNGIFDLDNV